MGGLGQPYCRGGEGLTPKLTQGWRHLGLGWAKQTRTEEVAQPLLVVLWLPPVLRAVPVSARRG